MNNIVLLSGLLLFNFLSFAEENGASKDRIGPGKAVVAANEKEGFKLSEKAQKSLKLAFAQVNHQTITVPSSSLVKFQDFLGVYRLRDGWFRLVEVEPTIRGDQAIFSSKDLIPGDQMIVQNSGLLRVVELDIFGPEADACAD